MIPAMAAARGVLSLRFEMWVVDCAGGIDMFILMGDKYEEDWIKHGMAFHTKEEAERKVLRMQAGAKRWLPEKYFYSWDFEDNMAIRDLWTGDSFQLADYWLGNTHRTRTECEEWGKKYGKGFEIDSI